MLIYPALDCPYIRWYFYEVGAFNMAKKNKSYKMKVTQAWNNI